MKTLAWAKKSDGTVKPMFDQAEEFHSSLLIDGTHVVELDDVDTYKIIGVGKKTLYSINYNTSDMSIDSLTVSDGDGTVPVYSALNNSSLDSEKTYCVEKDHVELITSDECIQYVIDIINEKPNVNGTSASTFSVQEAETVNTTDTVMIVTKHIKSLEIQNGKGAILYAVGEKMFYDDENGEQHCVGSVWILGENSYQYALNSDSYVVSNISEVTSDSTIRIDYCNYGLSESVVTFADFAEGDSIHIQQPSTHITTREGVAVQSSSE